MSAPHPIPNPPLPEPLAHLAAMAPYPRAVPARADGPPPIALAQNESLRPPSPRAIEAATRALGSALYSDPDWTALREAIAAEHALPAQQVLCGAGSMELIAAIAAAYLGPGRRALAPAQGYAFFRTATALTGAAFDTAPERAFTVDVDALLAALRPETAVVWLANPGNPTGTAIPTAEIARLRAALPANVLLVVDEAYGEFAAEAPAWPLVAEGNTVVLRTFSKAFGLAGHRVGWGVFPPAIAGEVRKTLNLNNISAASQAAATAAMRDQAYMRATVEVTARLREGFIARLRRAGIAVPDSHTNFALLDLGTPARAAALDASLRARNISLRGMGSYGLPHCLRATIGAADCMDIVAKAIEAFTAAEGAP
ncbi:MAG: histidinol-phosphate transaminase [Pseudomonadota bacterium]